MERLYGTNLEDWRMIRNNADPEGMFVGSWHRRYIMGDGSTLTLEEAEVKRKKLWKGGVEISGAVAEQEKGLSGNSSEESFENLRASEVTLEG